MDRFVFGWWVGLVSFVSGLIGGTTVGAPTPTVGLIYTGVFPFLTAPIVYWMFKRNADRVGEGLWRRIAVYFPTLFFVSLLLSYLPRPFVGVTGVAGTAGQLLAFLVGATISLWIAYGGGGDDLWVKYVYERE